LTISAIAALIAAADTIDPASTGARYAWGENVGWINAKAPGPGNPGVTVTGLKLTGYMWGENIGWINMTCSNNATCGSTGSYGVRNNGVGQLSGYAWGENVGWISFSCQNVPSTCSTTGNYGVTIDPVSGLFSGKAWGENIGWIVFDYTTSSANRVRTADDGDGLTYPSDNCPFDNNPAQLNTDAANTGLGLPGADALGDPCDADADGDGCTNDQEGSGAPAVGGLRNALLVWDFFDASVPRDRLISGTDVALVKASFGKILGDAGYSVHRDRTGGATPWATNAPNGSITGTDVALAKASFGHSCLGG
jgi:hypothetical protein